MGAHVQCKHASQLPHEMSYGFATANILLEAHTTPQHLKARVFTANSQPMVHRSAIRPVEAVRQSIADATAHVVARADAPKAATGARGLLAAAAAAGGWFAASNA
jgi:hypothetical protein